MGKEFRGLEQKWLGDKYTKHRITPPHPMDLQVCNLIYQTFHLLLEGNPIFLMFCSFPSCSNKAEPKYLQKNKQECP